MTVEVGALRVIDVIDGVKAFGGGGDLPVVKRPDRPRAHKKPEPGDFWQTVINLFIYLKGFW